MASNARYAVAGASPTRDELFAAYDAMPPKLRDELKYSPLPWEPISVLRAVRDLGVAATILLIRKQEEDEVALFARTVWPATHGVYPHVGANATILRQTPPRRRA